MRLKSVSVTSLVYKPSTNSVPQTKQSVFVLNYLYSWGNNQIVNRTLGSIFLQAKRKTACRNAGRRWVNNTAVSSSGEGPWLCSCQPNVGALQMTVNGWKDRRMVAVVKGAGTGVCLFFVPRQVLVIVSCPFGSSHRGKDGAVCLSDVLLAILWHDSLLFYPSFSFLKQLWGFVSANSNLLTAGDELGWNFTMPMR